MAYPLTWSNFRLALRLREVHGRGNQCGQDYRPPHGRLHGDTPRSLGQVSHPSHPSILSLHFLADNLTLLSLVTFYKEQIRITVSELK